MFCGVRGEGFGSSGSLFCFSKELVSLQLFLCQNLDVLPQPGSFLDLKASRNTVHLPRNIKDSSYAGCCTEPWISCQFSGVPDTRWGHRRRTLNKNLVHMLLCKSYRAAQGLTRGSLTQTSPPDEWFPGVSTCGPALQDSCECSPTQTHTLPQSILGTLWFFFFEQDSRSWTWLMATLCHSIKRLSIPVKVFLSPGKLCCEKKLKGRMAFRTK